LKPFLQSIQTLDLFQNIVADAGYGSEENYSFIIDELEKSPLIPYGMYQKELTKKYKNSPTNPNNWDYLEETDQFIKPDGVVYSFKYYSRRKDKYGFERDFKIYEAEKIQSTEELEKLSKTESGRQKQIHYNPTWNYFKELIKEELHSEDGSRIYAKRKIDVEPVFGRLKSVFGVRRVHVRGNQAVQTEVGFLFMSMNLTKLAKNLDSKTSNTQKPHSDFFILIVFKTEISAWFYLKLLFAQPLVFHCVGFLGFYWLN
ncbi:IS5/IS1182 family transposase, partial [Streptococcus iniae]